MAIAVESTGTKSFATGATCAVPKPSSLAVGEWMVAIVCANGGTSSNTISTLSGWTSGVHQQGDNATLSIQYKQADSGDTAASTFTFSTNEGTNPVMAGCILRLSGVSDNDNFDAGEGDSRNSTATVNINFTGTTTPSYDNSLVIVGLSVNGQGYTNNSISAFTSTPTLSFTQAIDTSIAQAGGNYDPGFSVGYATQSTAAQITAYGGTNNNTESVHVGALATITPQTNGSVTLDSISLTATPQDPSLTGSATLTLDSVSLTATPNDVTASAPTPTWTNKSKNSTSVTNKNKS